MLLNVPLSPSCLSLNSSDSLSSLFLISSHGVLGLLCYRCWDADGGHDAAVVDDVQVLRFRRQGVLNYKVAAPDLVEHAAFPVRWYPLFEACAESDLD